MKKLNSLHQFQIQHFKKTGWGIPVDPIRFKIILSLVGKRNKVLELGCYNPSFTKSLTKQKK